MTETTDRTSVPEEQYRNIQDVFAAASIPSEVVELATFALILNGGHEHERYITITCPEQQLALTGDAVWHIDAMDYSNCEVLESVEFGRYSDVHDVAMAARRMAVRNNIRVM